MDGIPHFPSSDEEILGSAVRISAGGKSRNIAEMIARILGQQRVSMVGKTCRDEYGFWKVPVEALDRAGVDIQFVKVFDQRKGAFPGITFIPVTVSGEHQIFYVPGATQQFSPQDIHDASALFSDVGSRHGFLCMALEHRLDTATAALELAQKFHLRSYIDTGGMQAGLDYAQIFSTNVELVKPNIHEAFLLSGVHVTDTTSATQAAKFFFQYGVKNVLITAGSSGAFLVTQDQSSHITVPDLQTHAVGNSTGCGDQVLATLISYIEMGYPLSRAAQISVVAGTLQFHQEGVFPIDQGEIERYI